MFFGTKISLLVNPSIILILLNWVPFVCSISIIYEKCQIWELFLQKALTLENYIASLINYLPKMRLEKIIPLKSLDTKINKTGLQPVSRTCGNTFLGFFPQVNKAKVKAIFHIYLCMMFEFYDTWVNNQAILNWT